MHCARLNHAAVMALTTRRAVTGAPWAKLLATTTATRCASTFSATPPRQQSEGGSSGGSRSGSRNSDRHRKPAKTPAKRTVSRMLSVDVAKFMRPSDGHLTTTPENARFFRANPTVDHDHGIMTRLDATDAVRRLAKTYRVRLAWSPRHVIHPHRLRFLDPRGHPLAPKIRSDCARKAREDALWAFATAVGGDSAVVWQLTKRELLRAVFRSLTALGYDEHGRKQDGTELCGTLWLTVSQAQHARRLPVEAFGEVVADTLDKHYATRPEERRAALVADAVGAEEDARGKKELSDGMKRRASNSKPWTHREQAGERGRHVPAAEAEASTTWQPRKRT